MEPPFNIIAGLGLVGSLALLAWGMVLSLRQGFGADAGPQREIDDAPGGRPVMQF